MSSNCFVRVPVRACLPVVHHGLTAPVVLRRTTIAALALVCTSVLAWSQQPQVSGLKNLPAFTNTPRLVREGTAPFVEAYNPSSKLRLAISIKAPKMAAEEAFLKQLQDKSSPNFHKYLSPEQWNARFAPSAEDEQAVVDWLVSQGLTITARYPNRLMVNVEGTVDTIQKALNLHINRYQVNGTTEFSNDRDPAIPAHLKGIVEYVDGLNSIMRMRPANPAMKGMRGPDYAPGPMHQIGKAVGMNADKAAAEAIKRSSGAQIGSQITDGRYDPSDIWSQQAYNYNGLQNLGHCCNPLGNPGQSPPEATIGLATDGAFDNNDILGFHDQYTYLAGHYNYIYVDGTPGCCDDETTLDLEWSLATSNSRGSGVDTAFIWVYETAEGFGDFGTIFQQMVTDNYIRVVNISYGLPEFWFLDNAPSLLTSWHATFNQMIGQGWTIMAASGDNGTVAGCTSAVAVLYPESDPDVVSVGGTQLNLNPDGTFNTEVAWTGDTFPGACGENDGGGGGGCSQVWGAPGYQHSPACGSSSRSVPDVALMSSAHPGINFYFGGSLDFVAGTSDASPMMSGFIAQENAYSLSMGNACGGGTRNCAPIGEVNYDIYAEGGYNESAPHYPFYDITSGCTSNDITIADGTGAWCAEPGYDLATGWGSFNALQLAWAINWEDNLAYDAPSVAYSGPAINTWYNSDQIVGWSVNANGNVTGIAGFTQGWDSIPSDPFFDSDRNDSNSFFSGPQYPNATTGCLSFNGAGGCAGGSGQGCHTAHVRAWSNQGSTSGDTTYGPVCYDTVAPHTTATLSGTLSGGKYVNTVTVTLNATDPNPGSGVKSTVYQINGGAVTAYTAPFTVQTDGANTVTFHSTDVAGNVEGAETVSLAITSTTNVYLSSNKNPDPFGKQVKFTAYVTANVIAALPTGTVTFKDGATALGTRTMSAVVGGGEAILETSSLALGTHTITATYNGATYFLANTSSSLAEVVENTTTTTLTSLLNPSDYGQKVKFKAKIGHSTAGTPTGTVTFTNGTVTLGVVAVNTSTDEAEFSTSTLSVATHSIKAVYSGDSTFAGSTSAVLSQVVNKAGTSTTLVSSANPSTFKQKITLTATVKSSTTGTPAGTVNFMQGATLLDSHALNSSGVAAYSTSKLAVGTDDITAVYVGSDHYTTSTSPVLKQVVNNP